MSYNSLVDPGMYLISDTFLCDGTGALLLLLKNLKKKVQFISDPGNYSHYHSLLKKNGVSVTYFELNTNIEYRDLPMTEDSPVTWLDAPKKIDVRSLLIEINKKPEPVIVIEDLYSILLEIGSYECFSLLNSLKALCEVLIVKLSKQNLMTLWMIEEISDVLIEVKELESGFTQDCQGKLRIVSRKNHIQTEIGYFWYKIVNDNFEIIE
jgi:archaellum biogenesis ATPase FlaH